MKTEYYKPKGQVLMYVIDWMMGTKNYVKKLDKFLTKYAMQASDLLYDSDGNPVEINYYPAIVDGPIDDDFSKIGTKPSYSELGAVLGVEQARALTTTAYGTLLIVMGDTALAGYTPLTGEELLKYGIHVHDRDCPECGLWMSYGEHVCHRCGAEVPDEPE
jgi:hypothetical protein